MSEPRCETCRWWGANMPQPYDLEDEIADINKQYPDDDGPAESECKRFPPSTFLATFTEQARRPNGPVFPLALVDQAKIVFNWFFPVTDCDNGCGEHQPKEKADEA